MRSFISFIIRYPVAVLLVTLFLGFMGIYSAFYMPIDLFPNLEIPVVNIVTHLPGASPEDVEVFISRPIENEMMGIPGVKRVSSISQQGLSLVTIEFQWGTKVKDVRQLVQTHLSHLKNRLPEGSIPVIESIGTTLQEVCGYIFYGADLIQLRTIISHDVRARIMNIPGVSSVDVIGGERPAFIIRARIKDMLRADLSLKDIIAAVRRNNSASVLGFEENGGREFLIHGDARINSIQDLSSIPIKNGHGRLIFLGQIADVFRAEVPKHYIVHGNGVPAVAMIIRKQPGASAFRVSQDCEKALLKLRSILPRGTKFLKFYDQSEILLESRHEIVQNLFIGAGLAIIILYLFLGSIRPTFIVALQIPLTLIITLLMMHIFHLGFNMITMTAIALAVGMIVDDAIIITENIHRHFDIIKDPKGASITGTTEIVGADISGTLTTVVAFLPLLLVKGIASVFLRPFALTIGIALLISLILSITIVPLLFSRIMRPDDHYEIQSFGNKIMNGLRSILKKGLHFSFRHKGTVGAIIFLLLLFSGLVLFLGKTALLPPVDEGAILIEYVMPPGTSLKESNRIGDILERIALSNSDVTCVYRRTGSPEIGYQVEGVNRGELLIKLKPRTIRSHTLDEVMGWFKKRFSQIKGCVFLYHQPTQEKIDEAFAGLPSMFGVTIYGHDIHMLSLIAEKVEKIMRSDPAVSNIINNLKIKSQQIDIRLRYAQLGLYGLSPGDVFDMVRAMHMGVEVSRVIKGKQEIHIIAQLDPGIDISMENIGMLPIPCAGGRYVRLKDIAEIRLRPSPSFITRMNGERETTLMAEVEGNIPQVAKRLMEKFKRIPLRRGYSIEVTGQYKVLIITALEMIVAFFLAIIFICLIMVIQFNSWRQPMLVLITVPFAMVGGIIALFITRQGLNISVGMGMVTLAGIAVNNAIVLIDYANKGVASGKCTEEALISATMVRLRPILLTSLTTIAALLPTAIGKTVGSQIFKPFAITVTGGLITSMLTTLVLVPVLYKQAVAQTRIPLSPKS